jgi:hypothetical protein
MADIVQTAANVKSGAGAVVSLERAGEAIDQGMPCYISNSDGKWYKADADNAAKYLAAGIAMTKAAAADDYFLLQKSGRCNLGATLTTGEVYVVSATAGKIAPVADITTDWYPCIVGISESTTGNVLLAFQAGSVKRPA